MESETPGDLTLLIREAQAGSDGAKRALIEALYRDLREIASRRMRDERAGHTLDPTALVHEALIRLLEGEVFAKAEHRGYLYSAANLAMGRVLIDHARGRGRARRGGGLRRLPIDAALDLVQARGGDAVTLNDALDRLAEREPLAALVARNRFLLGMTIAEVARALGVSTTTIEYEWELARVWLFNALGGEPS